MATKEVPQIGMLSGLGLPQHSKQEELRRRSASLYNAQVQNLPLNDSSLATMGARIGSGLGVKLAPPTLEEQEKKKFELVENLSGMLDTFKKEYPDEWSSLTVEDRALLYNRALAETAFGMGLDDIGAQAAAQYGEAAAARQKRDLELERLGYQTKSDAAKVITDARTAGEAGDLIRLRSPDGKTVRNVEKDNRLAIQGLTQQGWTQEQHPAIQRSTVTNLDPYTKEAMKSMAAGDSEWYFGVVDAAEQATANMPLYDVLLDEFSDAYAGGGFKTGALADVRHGVGKLMELAGMPVPQWIGDPDAADRIEGVMSELAVDISNQMSRLTNMSIALVKDSLPNLAKTTTGNMLIARMQRFIGERSMQEAEFVEEFRRKWGPTLTDDQGYHVRERLREWRKLPENDITATRREFERQIRQEARAARRYTWEDVLRTYDPTEGDVRRDAGKAQRTPSTAMPPAAQGAMDQATWDAMTPEQKALFQ